MTSAVVDDHPTATRPVTSTADHTRRDTGTRRAKIVCTLGPATSTEEAIAALLDVGMNVARMNFSHGEHADHEVVYHRLRDAANASGQALAIMADLQGPKIRLGRFADGPHDWHTGGAVTITVEDVVGSEDRVSTSYKGLARDARPGDRLLIDYHLLPDRSRQHAHQARHVRRGTTKRGRQAAAVLRKVRAGAGRIQLPITAVAPRLAP